MAAIPQALLETFGPAGRQFAAALRRLLPIIATGTPAEQDRARAELQRLAYRTSAVLAEAGRKFLTHDLVRSYTTGARAADVDIGVRFGGVNISRVQQLALDLAPRLAEAAQSVRPYLTRALGRANAVAAQLQADPEMVKPLQDVNRTVTQSLLRATVRRDTSRQAQKALLRDLGLVQGDRVLLLSGRQIDARVYAETVTRTKLMEAANLGRADEYAAHGVLYIQTSEHTVDDPDDICNLLQGQVWALGPNPYGIAQLPPAYGFPPWHPNCAHTFSAWIPEFNGGDQALRAVRERQERLFGQLQAWGGRVKK